MYRNILYMQFLPVIIVILDLILAFENVTIKLLTSTDPDLPWWSVVEAPVQRSGISNAYILSTFLNGNCEKIFIDGLRSGAHKLL